MSDPQPSDDAGLDLPETTSVIGWLELFFDLVVVAAIAVLTDGLREEPGLEGVGMFLLLYGAIWMTWTSVVLYANVAEGSTRTGTVVLAMFLIAMMAASAPSHFEARANAFAIGFLVARAFVGRAALRTGRILTGWPLLQFGGLATPWVVAIWVDTPWKYWLWALGLVGDLVFVVLRGDADMAAQVASLVKRQSRRRPPPRGRPVAEPPRLVTVDVNATHLDERLGIFVIIVLGEAVSQLVFAAATVEWTRQFQGSVIAGFLILVGLWWLTFSYGFAAAPHTRLATLPPRLGLPLHLLTTIGIICLAAGLGAMATASDESLEPALRWIMCGGLSLYFVATGFAGLSAQASRSWLLAWAVPCALAPIAVGLWGDALGGNWLGWLLLAPVLWQTLYGQRLAHLVGSADRSDPSTSRRAPDSP